MAQTEINFHSGLWIMAHNMDTNQSQEFHVRTV